VTHTYTLGRTPLDEGSVHRRPVTDSTQHSLGTEIHAPGGIQSPESQQSSDRRPTP